MTGVARLPRDGSVSSVAELDRLMDAAACHGGPFSPSYSARLDRTEEFPAEAVRVLDEFGVHRYFVPARFGGRQAELPEVVDLLRAVARRDLTVAIAYGKTFLGVTPVWAGGTSEQSAWLARQVLENAMVTWALTERGHGADLMSGEVGATRTADGWQLDGAKWLINNATRAPLVLLLARTDAGGGPRGFSLFLVDKRSLEPGSYTCLPKEPLHGIRGADISGIDFHEAKLPADAVVNAAGTGFEIVLKSLQVTRTVCTALSLGAADHALRLAADFTQGRMVYGRRLSELPGVRWVLGEAIAGALLAEVVTVVATRSIHTLTGEMSVISAIVKALVPELVEDLITAVGELLGARGQLIDEYADGLFQKLDRDHRIVAIFDGSTTVNRNALINQFPVLDRRYRKGGYDEPGLNRAADLTGSLPELDTSALTLLSKAGCSVVQSVPKAVAEIRRLGAQEAAPDSVVRQAREFGEAVDGVLAELAEHRPERHDVPAGAFALAQRYEACFAGAACLRLWLHNVGVATDRATLWRDATWLSGCLARVLALLGAGQEADAARAYESLAEVLLATEGGAVPSILTDVPTAEPRVRA
ncbi:acyl-CoA dehydrogenase family protein [Amycolatopsis sp. H20-H5]|uniref:acyl-CoA dehydrogenase family protein n=1 Tax=Amycolatopsis sp. H20-H5 TaxID=3046309 RepID=UPI002DBDB8B0|nr:acyl-CoA dehydrogenase family protein [Amycolatopsis sp. H20-H5]MEC3975526.1 acyl-CoA dehydrogenase family protein [Amycolatopsis sp. H20-H5]